MKIENLKQKLESNELVKLVIEIIGKNSYIGITLVGGAIIDIIEGRKPRDYDFLAVTETTIQKFIKKGFVYQYTTKSSQTFKKGKIIIQFLTSSISDFDFKISQSTYNFQSRTLTIDEISFKYKTLIPISFTNYKNAVSSLMRIPHWQKKGYTINDKTYLSLLNIVINTKIKALKS